MKLTESEIKQENVVAEHSAAINAISEDLPRNPVIHNFDGHNLDTKILMIPKSR